MSYQALILAGGLGTRLRSVVSDLPKPMAPIGGKPFLEHLMRYWRGQGVTEFVLSVGYKWENVRDYFGDSFMDAPVRYAVENTPLGTGGALFHSLEWLNPCDDFLFVNGDTFFEVELDALRKFYRERAADVALSLFRVAENTRYSGIQLGENGQIQSFQAQGASTHPLINGGVYVVSYPLLKSMLSSVTFPVSLEGGLFTDWVSKGKRIFGAEFSGKFIDIGIPEDYRRAEKILVEEK